MVYAPRAWLALVVLPAGMALAAPAAAQATAESPVPEYRPGQGWTVPGTGIGIGGYAAANYENLRDAPTTLTVDNLSLFLHWEGQGRLRLFAEVSLENPLVIDADAGHVRGDSYVALERAYGDVQLTDALSLRLGKFLTPIGRWNLAHADPLVWTTSRPLITERAFPTNATGVMAHGSFALGGRPVDLAVYGAVGPEWRPDPRLDPFTEAYGLHAATPLTARADLGLSLVSFEQRSSIGERRSLVGLDYGWSRDGRELTAEGAYRFSDEGSRFDEKGLFVQGVWPLAHGWSLVGRYEFYDPAGDGADLNLRVLGVAYKPTRWLVLKGELRSGGHRDALAPDGVLASVAVLF